MKTTELALVQAIIDRNPLINQQALIMQVAQVQGVTYTMAARWVADKENKHVEHSPRYTN